MKTTTLFLFLIVFQYSLLAQKGTVSGTLEAEGLPLPGVSITVKGKTLGTLTDFDGNYSIQCEVGDELHITYTGFKTRIVTITAEMFDADKKQKRLKLKGKKQEPKPTYQSESPIRSSAFSSWFTKNEKSSTLSIQTESKGTHDLISSYGLATKGLKRIKVDSSEVKLKYYDSDLYYNLNFSQSTIYRFVQNKNLHALQRSFAQLENVISDNDSRFSYGLPIDGGKTLDRYSIFNSNIKTINSIGAVVNSSKLKTRFNYTNKQQKPLLGEGQLTSNQYLLKAEHKSANNDFNLILTYGNQKNTQPNSNGLFSKVIRNSYTTPPSFDNNIDLGLSNANSTSGKNFILGISDEFKLFKSVLAIKPQFDVITNRQQSNFSVPQGRMGFDLGYESIKKVKDQVITPEINVALNLEDLNLKYTYHSGVDISKVNYDFLESNRSFNGSTFNNSRVLDVNRTTFRSKDELKYDFDLGYYDYRGFISVANHITISSLQGKELWQPVIQGKINIKDFFQDTLDLYFVRRFALSGAYSKTVGEPTLFYNNTSHSSLLLYPIQADSYTANDELFSNNTLSFEYYTNYHFGADISLLSNRIALGLTRSYKHINNSVLPVLDNNTFVLKNAVNSYIEAWDAKLDIYTIRSKRFRHKVNLNFSSYKNRVTEITTDTDRIPIAGFQNISKNIIEGQPVGVFVGSTYARDTNDKLIIGADGFPLVDPEAKIIGDPNPNFNLGITNSISFGKGFNFQFTFDIQKGGDVWNGTQQVLNYLGASQETADLRNINNYTFNRVTSLGLQNTTAVDFFNADAPLQNRWTRYGYTGVDEDAIVDGSYINLRSISLNYQLDRERSGKKIFQNINIGLYANNLFTISKYEGASPYTNLFNGSSADGLQFFNTPIVTEVGANLKLKF